MHGRPEYVEIRCKSAVNRVQNMPYLKWSLNPYGGCVHRCRFCFAVQYRVVADQGTQQDFGTRLFIKTNFVEVLARELLDNISRGLEGVVVKRLDSPYQAGARNFNWVKLKRHSSGELTDTVDLVLLGYYGGKGKRAEFGAGALLAGVYDSDRDEFVTISKLGTGLSDEGWRELHKQVNRLEVEEKPARVNSILVPDVWLQPEVVVEVLADEITPSPRHTAGMVGNQPGFALRFPRIVSFRSADKKPEDATSVVEIREMFEQQHRR